MPRHVTASQLDSGIEDASASPTSAPSQSRRTARASVRATKACVQVGLSPSTKPRCRADRRQCRSRKVRCNGYPPLACPKCVDLELGCQWPSSDGRSAEARKTRYKRKLRAEEARKSTLSVGKCFALVPVPSLSRLICLSINHGTLSDSYRSYLPTSCLRVERAYPNSTWRLAPSVPGELLTRRARHRSFPLRQSHSWYRPSPADLGTQLPVANGGSTRDYCKLGGQQFAFGRASYAARRSTRSARQSDVVAAPWADCHCSG